MASGVSDTDVQLSNFRGLKGEDHALITRMKGWMTAQARTVEPVRTVSISQSSLICTFTASDDINIFPWCTEKQSASRVMKTYFCSGLHHSTHICFQCSSDSDGIYP